MKRVMKILLCAALAAVCLGTFPISDALGGADGVRYVNHRGYNSVAPENTLPAFELSGEMGFDWVETDIRFTRDGVPVLLHDALINRTAREKDGRALKERIAVGDLTYAELEKYDFGVWKGREYAGTGIPTLEAFLRLCLEKDLSPYLELKEDGAYTWEMIVSLVDMVRECGLGDRAVWISFDREYLEWVRDRDPSARLGMLETVWLGPGSVKRAIENAKGLMTGSNEVFLDVMYAAALLYPGCAAMCRDAGIPLEVYSLGTVDDPEGLAGLDSYVSGMTVNGSVGNSR